MAGIDPEKYQDYVAGRISFEQAQSGYTGQITVNPNPVNIFDSYYNFPKPVVPVPIPSGVQAGSTNYPTATGVDPSISSARDARIKQKSQNVWSNDPTIAGIEQKDWDIYIETGRWDSPEQIVMHQQAEEIRKGLNPMYPGSVDGGTQNRFILPTNQFPTANGMDSKGLVTIGALGLGAILLMSMLKG